MVVGKTSSSISKKELLNKYSETQILATVFPYITEIPCVICSPLRVDHNPSFSIYMHGNHVRYKDLAYSSVQGGLVDLLSAYWNCSLKQTIEKISKLMIKKDSITLKQKQEKVLVSKSSHKTSQIEVKVRPWRDYDYEYWQSYGITKPWLKYAEIYPISHEIITKKDKETGINKRYVFPTEKYSYCYVERKEGKLQLKVYQPYNTKGFKWCSKMDSSVIGLWTKIPKQGDRVIICSSLKDALVVSCQLNIPTLCLQGEGYSMSDTAIRELKKRYKKIFISFDTDEAGIIDGKKLAERTGFTNVIPNLGTEKDFSDFYKSLENKNQFKQLKQLFN